LVSPVKVYGNIITASCGETVSAETLGSGDASESNQFFTLKKKPLTYTASPTADNERGVASTLKVYVNGILWSEVSSFYGVKPDAQVYIVRQNDKGESTVTFGDGKRGARLPSGTDNVVAYYRYGGGAAAPPAGSITQIAKPVKGLKRVKNPVAAYGGADADSIKEIRKYAPRSALVMGRAVSMQDMEAVAAGVPGVRAVRVEWRWSSDKQRPVVQVWYIGKSGIASTVSQRLRNLSDPSTPIDVKVAQGIKATLSLDIEIDSKYLASKVLAAVRAKLMGKKAGMLVPEQIGIGAPLYRSHIFEAVLAVPGVKSVRGIWGNNLPFIVFAVTPGAGKYFDLESGDLVLNGKAS
jgi:predicted phage baseplate assembly protein